MWAFIANILGKITGRAIKGGVETAKSVTDIQKNRLDIKLKQKELKAQESVIKVADAEDIERFDPKIEKIRRAIITNLWTLLLFILILLAALFTSFFIISPDH